MLSLAHRRYRNRPDPGALLAWLIQRLADPNALVVRSESAWCVAVCTAPPWYPDQPECHVTVLVGEVGAQWQAARLLRETVGWAEDRGCVRWLLSSDTEYDFAPLAKRMGALTKSARYERRLR
jgi:hypothetical protein